MKATVVVDNIKSQDLMGEWGLSIYITYHGKKILLDVGASGLFLENAKKLGIAIEDVDYAVLSHAHYDHANGMKQFFNKNPKANFYLRDGSGENCYFKFAFLRKYIGIPKGILSEYKNRIIFAKGDYELMPGVTLIPHKASGLEAIGKANRMYVREGKTWRADDFSHEQSLVFDTRNGLVIFNSCSHGGAAQIISEVAETFPKKKIHALIGGFHIYNKSEAEVRELAEKIKDTGIEEVYTGHCTGEKPFEIMRDVLGDKIKQLHVGLEIPIDQDTDQE